MYYCSLLLHNVCCGAYHARGRTAQSNANPGRSPCGAGLRTALVQGGSSLGRSPPPAYKSGRAHRAMPSTHTSDTRESEQGGGARTEGDQCQTSAAARLSPSVDPSRHAADARRWSPAVGRPPPSAALAHLSLRVLGPAAAERVRVRRFARNFFSRSRSSRPIRKSRAARCARAMRGEEAEEKKAENICGTGPMRTSELGPGDFFFSLCALRDRFPAVAVRARVEHYSPPRNGLPQPAAAHQGPHNA